MMLILYGTKERATVGAVDRTGAAWASVAGKDLVKPLAKVLKTTLGQKKPTHIIMCTQAPGTSPEKRQTWSQVRGMSVVTNTLGFAHAVPVVSLSIEEKTTKRGLIKSAVDLVHHGGTKKALWIIPTYDGEPNITTPT